MNPFLSQGSTELSVLPLTSTGKLWKVPLNCKQCRILRVIVENQYSAKYSYVDPLLSVTPQETKKWKQLLTNISVLDFVFDWFLFPLRRNLEYYDACQSERLKSCDPDTGPTAGELTIKIPKDVYSSSSHRGWIYTHIHYNNYTNTCSLYIVDYKLFIFCIL